MAERGAELVLSGARRGERLSGQHGPRSRWRPRAGRAGPRRARGLRGVPHHQEVHRLEVAREAVAARSRRSAHERLSRARAGRETPSARGRRGAARLQTSLHIASKTRSARVAFPLPPAALLRGASSSSEGSSTSPPAPSSPSLLSSSSAPSDVLTPCACRDIANVDGSEAAAVLPAASSGRMGSRAALNHAVGRQFHYQTHRHGGYPFEKPRDALQLAAAVQGCRAQQRSEPRCAPSGDAQASVAGKRASRNTGRVFCSPGVGGVERPGVVDLRFREGVVGYYNKEDHACNPTDGERNRARAYAMVASVALTRKTSEPAASCSSAPRTTLRTPLANCSTLNDAPASNTWHFENER